MQVYVVCVTTKGYPDIQIYCVTNKCNVFELFQNATYEKLIA